jgi:hypothetical protein
MQSYIDAKTHDTACCDGTVQDNICPGSSICTLTPTATSKLPACSSYLRDYNARMAKEHCFDTMSKYYEDNLQVPMISGCASNVNTRTTAPALNATKCTIYSTVTQNRNYGDSCENRKMVFLAQNSNFCKTANCTSVETVGNNRNIAWVMVSYPNGSTLASCESKESVIRHLKYGSRDGADAVAPLTGQALTDALAQVDAGTYPGMCPASAPYTPSTIPLQKLQEMFNTAGCTSTLTEDGTTAWWRKRGSITDIQNDMNAYGSLTRGCTGSRGQHEFCSPGKCPDYKVQYVMIRGKSGKGFLGVSQIVVKNKQGINIARNPKQMWASQEYNPQSTKERVVDGNEKIREYPYIYHSIETDRPYLTFELNTPTNLSNIASITVYGREGCCPERNAGKEITLYKETAGGGTAPQNIIWTSPVTNDNLVQTFTVS